MILILEDDADREAFQRGPSATFTHMFGDQEQHTVWISPDAYLKEIVVPELHRKLMALPFIADGYRNFVLVSEVLDLMDEQ